MICKSQNIVAPKWFVLFKNIMNLYQAFVHKYSIFDKAEGNKAFYLRKWGGRIYVFLS